MLVSLLVFSDENNIYIYIYIYSSLQLEETNIFLQILRNVYEPIFPENSGVTLRLSTHSVGRVKDYFEIITRLQENQLTR